MTMTTIYLGMALSETPEWWRNEFHDLVRQALSKIPDVTVTKFVGLDKTTSAGDVYDYDIDLASKADMMVALTRFPSLGLGMEIQARSMLKKPTMLMHPAEMYLSKMPRGAPCTQLHLYSQAGTNESAVQEIRAHVRNTLVFNAL